MIKGGLPIYLANMGKELNLMTNNLIITISRQYGSGGRDIGLALAQSLDVAFYDKELIKLAAKKSGINEKLFENADEMPSNSFLYSLSMGSRNLGGGFNYNDCLTNDKLFLLQSKVIRELADKEPCVIVGRCADYILREYPRVANIFIHASDEYRVRKVMGYENVDEAKARDIIRKTDKKRTSYYNYYSDVIWGNACSYHLSIDSSVLSKEDAVAAIRSFLDGFQKK